MIKAIFNKTKKVAKHMVLVINVFLIQTEPLMGRLWYYWSPYLLVLTVIFYLLIVYESSLNLLHFVLKEDVRLPIRPKWKKWNPVTYFQFNQLLWALKQGLTVPRSNNHNFWTNACSIILLVTNKNHSKLSSYFGQSGNAS